jgi:Domain of unknown function (DUF4158)
MLAFVADQLGLKGDLFAFYGRREDTRLAHAQHLQADLGLRTATRDDRRTTLLAGIEICAPIHDAFLIQAPLDRLNEDVERMKALMTGAGEAVTGGFPVRTDATIVRFPDRYMDEGGQDMWDRVMALLPDEVREAA